MDVNVRCLKDVELRSLAIAPYDGKNWEAHFEVYRARQQKT